MYLDCVLFEVWLIVDESVLYSSLLTNYAFDKYKEKKYEYVKNIEFVDDADITDIVNKAVVKAKATLYARDLGNERSEVCNPEYLEQQARDLHAKYSDKFDIEVVDTEQLVEKGMNLIYNVGKCIGW